MKRDITSTIPNSIPRGLVVAGALLVSGLMTAGATPRSQNNPIDEVREVKRGAAVKLRGEVVRIADEDEFILRDATGRIRVYIGWQNDMPVDVGDRVTVKGRADDDIFPGFRPEIYARSLVLANGETVDLRTGRTHGGKEEDS